MCKAGSDCVYQNIQEVLRRIENSCRRAGRDPGDIKLVAVTKTVIPDMIAAALDAGITNFGENRVQEIRDKSPLIKGECSWHMIGHLQKNKVKYIIDTVSLIHSADSIELVEEINKKAYAADRIMEILIQVNISGEQTKYGIKPEELSHLLKKINNYSNIKVKGLMTIAPFVENPESIRHLFAGLRKLSIDIKRENIDNIDMDYLSMGMSNDFEIAVEEGANILRIGSSIFGKRF